MLPNVFEAELCRKLWLSIRGQVAANGVMQVIDGKTQLVQIKGKKRRDITVGDPALRRLMHRRNPGAFSPKFARCFSSTSPASTGSSWDATRGGRRAFRGDIATIQRHDGTSAIRGLRHAQ